MGRTSRRSHVGRGRIRGTCDAGSALQQRRRLQLFTLCVCLGGHTASAVNVPDRIPDITGEGNITLLWPVHLFSVPLTTPGKAAPELVKIGKELAAIGLRGFTRYVEQMLPRELELDHEFAEKFRQAEHSRINQAFRRWQQRAFAAHFNVSLEDLVVRGDSAPKLEGIDYAWPELYDSELLPILQRWILELGATYMMWSSKIAAMPAGFWPFVWVEVFHVGDSLSPYSRMDRAYVTGRYFAAGERNSLKLNLEDPRGINPPYGKTYSHPPYEGNMVFFPQWASHFVTPNMVKESAVCFSFMVFPPATHKYDWRKDAAAAMKVYRPVPAQAMPAKPRQS